MKSVKSQNPILWATEYWLKASKRQIWLTTRKPFFWETKANLETLQKLSLYIWVSYKFVLKFVNNLNQIFWATIYWFKALKCQIQLRNTKPFFWENEANLETLQKVSLCIWVCYKIVLKSGKSLNRIFWATEYCLKAFKCQIWLTNTKPFFSVSEANIETLQKFFAMFEFPINFFWSLSEG